MMSLIVLSPSLLILSVRLTGLRYGPGNFDDDVELAPKYDFGRA